MKRIEYFSATWCGPCKALKPVMNELLVEGYNITFYDVDNDQDLAAQRGIRSVPTIIISENGVEVDRIVGVVSRTVLESRFK
jgi:thioredoxin 1